MLKTEQMEIKTEDLTLVRNISCSRMARVDLCRWNYGGGRTLVAKKGLLTGDTLRFKKELSSEISILLAAKHENIVEMLGYIHSEAEFGLVMQYYKFGSYHKAFIDTNCKTPRTDEEAAKMFPLKLRILKEISDAMHFLHSSRPKLVLHLDLKADNVLIDDGLHAKLTDFGLSEAKTVSRLSRQTSCADPVGQTKGTLFYISPEHLADPRCKNSTKTDVYAFGILSWQIVTDSNPYEDLCGNNTSLVIHHIQTTGCRPSLDIVPPCVPEALITKVIEESWKGDPKTRPTFEVILQRIEHEMKKAENCLSKVEEAVELAKRMIPTSVEDSLPEDNAAAGACSSQSSGISWGMVSNAIQRRGGLSRLNYGEFPIMATTVFRFRGIKIIWDCKCMCVKTGNSVEVKDYASPYGACENAVRRLIRDMIAKGIYPRMRR